MVRDLQPGLEPCTFVPIDMTCKCTINAHDVRPSVTIQLVPYHSVLIIGTGGSAFQLPVSRTDGFSAQGRHRSGEQEGT